MSSSESTRGPGVPVAAEPRVGSLPSLTGMRFLAAAMMFLTHVVVFAWFASAGVAGTYAKIVEQGAYAGVVYFFVLSGFVLTWAARQEGAGSFWGRRIVRLYPAYVVALGAGILVTIAVEGQGFHPWWAVRDLLLVQSWWPDIESRSSFNAPLWSLSVEALFYLCFPLLLALVARIRAERLWAWAGGLVVAIFAVPVFVRLLPQGTPYPDFGTTSTEVWIVQQFPPTRLLEFVLGMVLARVVLARRRLPLGLGGAVALAVVAYWLSAYTPTRFDLVALNVIPFALIVVAAAAQDREGRPSLVSGRVWTWLGDISYAFFLLNYLVLAYARFLLGERVLGTAATFALLAGLFLVTVALSWLLHVAVERPLMRRVSRRYRDEQQEPARLPLRPAAVRRDAA